MRISGEITFGPRLEKEVIDGAGLVCVTVFAGNMYAVGFFVELMYFRILMASSDVTAVAGRTCASAGNSAPFAGLFPSI